MQRLTAAAVQLHLRFFAEMLVFFCYPPTNNVCVSSGGFAAPIIYVY